LPLQKPKGELCGRINEENISNPIPKFLKQYTQAAPPFYKLCHYVAGQLFYQFKGHFAMPLKND